MSPASHANNPWFRISKPNPSARLRLFCFPHAGGTASLYRLWSQYLSADIEICAVQLPGRENRIHEPPFTEVGDLTQQLMPHIRLYLAKPFAFFGHSMGTIIAYELAQQLHHQTGQTPTNLLVSGRRAPFLPDLQTPLHTITSDEALLKEMQRRYNHTPSALFEDAELRALFMPLLRADFKLIETYQYLAREPLSCPVVAFGGQDDHNVTQAELMAWQQMTHCDFDLHVLPGGHFYLEQQIQPLLAIVKGYL